MNRFAAEMLVDSFTEYIKALIVDHTSEHVEDAVRLAELRKDLIAVVMDKIKRA